MRRLDRLLEVGDQVVDVLDARPTAAAGRAAPACRRPRRWRGARSGSRRRRARSRASTAGCAPPRAIAAASPPATRIDSMPPKPPCICRAATAWPWLDGSPGIEHLGDERMPVEVLGDRAAPRRSPPARAGTACACRAAAATPRTSRACRRLRRAPCARAASASSSARVIERAGDDVGVAVEILGRRVHHDVGAERERPGQHRRRDGRVDRDAARRRRARASAVAAMSVTVQSGLAGVSIQTSFVVPGRSAACTAAGSVMSMSSTSSPH